MSCEWRLILDGPHDGAWNMAFDRAIQLARDAGEVPPTLRLYRWSRPTVSLGRFQPAEDVDLDACRELGVDVVRRATGGRGVLHDREVTYCCVASVADGVPRGVAASYRHLCAALVRAYQDLGVRASLTSRPRGRAGVAACYLHATHADVSHGDAKLSGSAQVWHGETVLQHGSIVLSRDVELEAAVFRLPPDEVAALRNSTATLGDLGAPTLDAETVSWAVARAWEATLGVRLVAGVATQAEHSTAVGLTGDAEVLRSGVHTVSES